MDLVYLTACIKRPHRWQQMLRYLRASEILIDLRCTRRAGCAAASGAGGDRSRACGRWRIGKLQIVPFKGFSLFHQLLFAFFADALAFLPRIALIITLVIEGSTVFEKSNDIPCYVLPLGENLFQQDLR